MQYFAGLFYQGTPQACLLDTTPPTFAGIAGLMANADGSVTASWLAASGTPAPLEYEVYIQASTATGLFNSANITTVTRSLLSKIYTMPDGTPLQKNVTYHVGVRARDGIGNLETNTVSQSAVSQGVPDNSIFSIVTDIKTVTDVLGVHYTPARASNLDNLDTTVSSRSTQASVDAIQNNTRFVGVVPPILKLPDSGSKEYPFYANLFDTAGNPEDPDSNTLNIRIETTSGGIVVATTAMTRLGQGRYKFSYTVNSTDEERPLAVFFEYLENGISFQQVRMTEVNEFESKLDTLLTRLTATRAGNLDFLDVSVASRATQTSVDTIWDVPNNLHLIPGSVGKNLADTAAGVSPTTVAQAIWDHPRNFSNIPSTFGEALQGVLSPARANAIDNLDLPISTRAPLATAVSNLHLTPSRAANLDLLDTHITTRATPADINAAVANKALQATLLEVKSLVEAFGNGQLTAAQVWTYINRTLTAAVDVTLDISNLATKTDLTSTETAIKSALLEWRPQLSVTINTTTDVLEAAAWLTSEGRVVTDATEATFAVFDAEDQLSFTVGPNTTPGPNGIFRFTRANASLVLERGKAYSAKVTIKRGSDTFNLLLPLAVF